MNEEQVRMLHISSPSSVSYPKYSNFSTAVPHRIGYQAHQAKVDLLHAGRRP